MAVALAALALALVPHWGAAQQAATSFRPLATFAVPDGVAEIVDATPDGNTLVYSNSAAGTIDFVDATTPSAPTLLGVVDVGGEPTSVAVAPDGTIAVAPVWVAPRIVDEPPPDTSTPGALFVIDIATRAIVGTVDIGFHPDSVKLAEVGGELLAVVAIENEPIIVEDGVVADDDAPGNPADISPPGAIQIITLNAADPAASTVTTMSLDEATLTAAGALFPTDPQPEFVDIMGETALVSLQENNAIAVVDLASQTLTRVFSLGIVADRPADLVEDDAISFTDTYPADVADEPNAGARFPDAIAFTPDGAALISADEGEVNFSGGRGWSAWSLDGALLHDDGGALEATAVRRAYYPEGRSENKGIEVEGVTTATFGGDPLAFLLSERGSFLAIYDITDPAAPVFRQLLPTGVSPEGIVAIPSRGLVVTADEGSGTLTLFEAIAGPYTPSPDRPVLESASVDVPWAAISGLAPNGHDGVVGVPDNALPTEVFEIVLGGPIAEVRVVTPVTRAGVQARYDGEGISNDISILAPAHPGWWLASEGNGAFGGDNYHPNLLVQVDADGSVLRELRLPPEIDSPTGGMIRSNGFEGVTVSEDGRYLVAPIQRQFVGEDPVRTRIARVDLQSASCTGLDCTGDWEFFFYPLEPTDDPSDNWVGLSEVVSVGPEQYVVVERDQALGGGSHVKGLYAFSLAGLSDGDTVQKTLWLEVRDDFVPYEKVEGVAILPGGDVWVGLDNDGGEVEPRLINYGALDLPLPAEVTVDVPAGVGFLSWSFGAAQASEVFAGAEIIFRFNASAGAWESFVPALGAGDFTLQRGDVLWVNTETALRAAAPR